MTTQSYPPLPDLGALSDKVSIIAGPCSVESREQFQKIAEKMAQLGLHWIRGGAFKPRTHLHSFQGLGLEALEIMKEISKSYGLKSLSEPLDVKQLDLVMKHCDGIQIGARNFQNFSLLDEIGRKTASSDTPILFKRGFAGSIAEWLAATERIVQYGNSQVMLCERGLRTFETATRFTLDISAVPVVHKLSLYPICVDVSHAAGQRDLIPSLARAALAGGADAIMIEVHPDPVHAVSDGPQQITLDQFEVLVGDLRDIASVLGKEIV